MRVSELIAQLAQLQTQVGDVEVLVTDGLQGHCYRANDQADYDITLFTDLGVQYIDIGIGGCLED